MPTTAIVVDDHPLCRAATTMALRAAEPGVTVLEGASLADARRLAPEAQVMTLDLALPDSRGVAALATLRREFPAMRMLVISGSGNVEVERRVAELGAQGYLSKEAPIDEMISALRTVIDKGNWFSDAVGEPAAAANDHDRIDSLTAAQYRVLRAMEGGRLNKQIAYDLGLSEITVKAHIKAILKKLEVVNRTQAVLMLQRVDP